MRDIGSKPMEFGKQSRFACRPLCILNIGHSAYGRHDYFRHMLHIGCVMQVYR